MTAEAIAAAVRDVTEGRYVPLEHPETTAAAAEVWERWPPTVIDCTRIYESIIADTSTREIDLYGDHPNIAPPFDSAAYCHLNQHGNVIVLHAIAYKRDGTEPPEWEDTNGDFPGWGHVRWIVSGFLWVGGYSRAHASVLPTAGPMMVWQFAISEAGVPLDLHWLQVFSKTTADEWTTELVTALRSMNFLNATNVAAVVPSRPRGERRRLDRIGVEVRTINVFPPGRSSRSPKREQPLGVPLTSVRGHYAHYGQCCPHHERKGLLFGKIEGRFWIPQHAIGDEQHGRRDHDYKLVPDKENRS